MAGNAFPGSQGESAESAAFNAIRETKRFAMGNPDARRRHFCRTNRADVQSSAAQGGDSRSRRRTFRGGISSSPWRATCIVFIGHAARLSPEFFHAKTPSSPSFRKIFLCAFAPLREAI